MVFRVVGKHFQHFNFDKSVRPHKLNYHNDMEQMYSYNRFDKAETVLGPRYCIANTVKFRKKAPPCISPSKYKPPKPVTQKNLR